jgi:hypothetical protein
VKTIFFRFFLVLFVMLDVVALPVSCYNDGKVEVRFYESDTYSVLLDSFRIEPNASITEDMFPTPERDGFVLTGWVDLYGNEVLVDADTAIIASGSYFQGNRNCMVFVAVWAASDANSTE